MVGVVTNVDSLRTLEQGQHHQQEENTEPRVDEGPETQVEIDEPPCEVAKKKKKRKNKKGIGGGGSNEKEKGARDHISSVEQQSKIYL